MGYAPLILNNSEAITKSLASEKSMYEAKYNISSYP